MTRRVPGQGKNNMYCHGAAAGGPDAIDRLRHLIRGDASKEWRAEALYFVYMAQEAGGGLINVPLESLRKFADLIRADTRAALASERKNDSNQVSKG